MRPLLASCRPAGQPTSRKYYLQYRERLLHSFLDDSTETTETHRRTVVAKRSKPDGHSSYVGVASSTAACAALSIALLGPTRKCAA
jgi:hypothetical protein